MNKRLPIVLAMLFSMTSLFAQTDYTSYIKNPSFENNTTGWVQMNMSAQGNNVFDIKAGNTYMEKWTGRGGAVGDGLASDGDSKEIEGYYNLNGMRIDRPGRGVTIVRYADGTTSKILTR